MKKCPNCSRIFDDDNDFCLEDGTLLALESGQQGFDGFQTSGEMPTQFVPRPQTVAAPPSTGSSPILYLVIGVLATALAAVGVYLLLLRDDGKKSEIVASNVPQANSTASPPPSTPSPSPAVAASAVPQTTIAGLSPSGTWSGDWVHGKQTSAFTAVTNLNESNGSVSGQIIWTLRRHTNPQKMSKTGLTATEYVKGTFDPVSRMVRLRGVRKDDPNNLVILDRYNLSVAEDGRTMSGSSKNGKFVLRR